MKTKNTIIEPTIHAKKTILENMMDTGTLTTLVAAIGAAGLKQHLSTKGPFTFFAPTDKGFLKLPAGTIDMLLLPESKERLSEILSHHVLWGAWKSDDFEEGEIKVATLDGKDLPIRKEGDMLKVKGTAVYAQDIISSNGVIHLIDHVLDPPSSNILS